MDEFLESINVGWSSKFGAAIKGAGLEHIDTARAAGASDLDIHDTVLITAAFCMYNRYVEGLGTREAAEHEYEPMGRRLRNQGYQPVSPSAARS
jgi:hypothetical protein